MNLIIDSYSMIPIYEQIVASIKHMILSGELAENEPLPSVRVLSRDLKISALTNSEGNWKRTWRRSPQKQSCTE